MKFCIPFDRQIKVLNDAAELIIDFNPGKSEARLQSFIDMWPDQTIIMDLKMKPPTVDLLAALDTLQDKEHFAIRFDKNNAAALDQIPKLDIRWFFTNAAETYDDIYTYKYLGASEFYIGAQLGFDLPNVSIVAKSLGMPVRSPYAYAYTDEPQYRPYWQYFIRPEDIELYGQYIDVVEFFGPPSFINILFKTYTLGRWNGILNEIIPTQKVEYDSRYMIPYWGNRRVRCQRKCMFNMNCSMCESVYELSRTLKRGKIEIPVEDRMPDVPEIKVLSDEETKSIPNF